MSDFGNATSDDISCDNVTVNDGETKKRVKYEITPSLKEKLNDIPEALEYIEKLHNIIKKQIKKISKWKTRIKKLQKPKDVFTQTDANVCFTTSNHNSPKCDTKETSNSLADDIKEAAEMAMQNSGFVYEETSGLYYDYTTGYYYNAEYGLYYDGTTGTYLKYNQETKTYEYHSQVQAVVQPEIKDEKTAVSKRKSKNGHNTKGSKRQREEECMHSPIDVEEGECSESDDCGSDEDSKSDTSDISKQWPPCVRIIVDSSDVPKVKVGSLHIITCDGGSIGREGHHSILLPDINTSKHHIKFTFEKESTHYFVTDLGSRNGTLLNGKRMSPSKQESEPMKISHGSKIQIGSTVLLCHIHDGNQTCGHCEPGLIQVPKETGVKVANRSSRAERHKNELKNLRKMCGVVTAYDEDPKLASGYTDRAQKRRETVGSQNPHEKTKMASLDESISSENKGFKLLSKMGWKEGQSLGKDGEGMLEPVKLVANNGTSGMGCNDRLPEPSLPSEKQNIWKKAQERFQKLPESNTAFEEDSED